MKIRQTNTEDIPGLRDVLDATRLFPSELLPDMVQGFLSGDPSADIWLTCEADGEAIGFCYAETEEMTDGTWNMLAIAVHPDKQGEGAGAALVQALEEDLRDQGQRILIVDTSGTAQFDRTRAFYRRQGYTQEARIRDFWAAGDDKVIFWKSLRA
eukprot:s1_g352.t1